MHKKNNRFRLLFWLVMFLGTLCHFSPGRASAAELLLFYSNDVHGETEPCG